MSILNSKAGVISRQTQYSEFITTENNIDVMNSQPFGSLTVSELSNGIEYPNAQSAINDIRNFTIRPINSIEINTDGISPEGERQSDFWKFAGTVIRPDGLTDDVIISVYGFPVTVSLNDTGEIVATKVKSVLATAMVNNKVIYDVKDGPTTDQLEISYIDNQAHVLPTKSEFGIVISQEIISPSKPGYGSWIRIGTKTETLDGAADPVLLHYFKRYA